MKSLFSFESNYSNFALKHQVFLEEEYISEIQNDGQIPNDIR
jgi:hypothetical protein